VIRPRIAADLAACVAALRLVHEQDRYPHRWPVDPIDWLSPPWLRRAWVAVADRPAGAADHAGDPPRDEVAGHVALNVAGGDRSLGLLTEATGLAPERLAVVSRLFVSVGHRRRGLARALLRHAVANAHGEHLRPVLDVVAADRAAVALYELEGWQRIGSVTFHTRYGASLPGYVYAGPPPPAPAPSAAPKLPPDRADGDVVGLGSDADLGRE
jgi:GNAT superfamily N-acetyltransferase